MDVDRFDGLTRRLTSDRSRRGALATVLAGALGLLGHVGSADAKRKKKKKQTCPKCPICPSEPPPPTPFCTLNNRFSDCQASGPRCVCNTTSSGAPVCISTLAFHGEESCGFCGCHEVCIIRGGAPNDPIDCASLCADPR